MLRLTVSEYEIETVTLSPTSQARAASAWASQPQGTKANLAPRPPSPDPAPPQTMETMSQIKLMNNFRIFLQQNINHHPPIRGAAVNRQFNHGCKPSKIKGGQQSPVFRTSCWQGSVCNSAPNRPIDPKFCMWGSFGRYIWFLFKAGSHDLYRGQTCSDLQM